MAKAIGMIEYATVSSGVKAADLMLKTAEVDIIQAETVCPGKYIVIVRGELSSVRACVDSSKETFPEQLIDSFVLGNPDDSIFTAINDKNEIKNPHSLGVIETFSAAAAVVAADKAAKTAEVELVELRLAKGMCGKSYLFITGNVANVTAAVEYAKESAAAYGMLLDSSIIANPDKKLWDSIL